MKRILVLLIIAVSVFSLVACNHNNEHEADEGQLAGIDPDKENVEDYDLTIATYMRIPQVGFLTDIFEQEYGLTVRIIKYKEGDTGALDTKLMAEDDDVDLFCTSTLDVYKYIQKGYYVDLNDFASLKSRIESNNYTAASCAYNNEYYGVSLWPFVSEITDPFIIYQIDNIDLIKGTFSDPDGEELFNVLKDLYGDNSQSSEYSASRKLFIDEYMIISPYSQNKETAVLFLEMVFDYINGNLQVTDATGNIVICENPYPDTGDLSDAYHSWNHVKTYITSPLYAAKEELLLSDGSDEALRKLAKDAAREVRKRLEG